MEKTFPFLEFWGEVRYKRDMMAIKSLEGKLANIAQQYGLADVYLFGSQATGFAHEGSDTDVAVRFVHGLPIREKRGKVYGELYADLAPCFPGDQLDLVFFEEAPLHIRFKIVTEGRLLYSADLAQTAEAQERTANLYRDYRYFIDEYMRGVRAAPISL